MKKHKHLALAAVALALSACGGGGEDSGASTATALSSVAAADKYVGSWLSDCQDSPVELDTAAGVALKETYRLTFTKTADNQLTYAYVNDIYPSAGCTGTPLASNTINVPTNTFTIDGTAVVGADVVDKVTVHRGNVGGIAAGGHLVVKHLVYPGDYFTIVKTYKDITLIDGTHLYFGDDKNLDAQGYPKAVDKSVKFVKQ